MKHFFASVLSLFLLVGIPSYAHAEGEDFGELQIPPKDGGGGTIQGIGGVGTTNYIPKFTSSTNLGNSVLYDANGNVGIGTTNPGSLLTLKGTGDGEHGLVVRESDDGADAVTLKANATRGYLQLYQDGLAKIELNAHAGAPTFFNNRGNVGIGTTSPAQKLHVAGGNATVLYVTDSGNDSTNDTFNATIQASGEQHSRLSLKGRGGGGVQAGSLAAWFDGSVAQNPGWLGTVSNQALGIGTSNTTRVLVDANGNVGIGTTSPAALLAVGSANQFTVSGNGDLTATGNAAIRAAQLSGVALHVGYDTAASLVVDGKIGIGTSQPEVPLEVVGDLQARGGRLLLTQANPVNTLIIENTASSQASLFTNTPTPLALGTNNNLTQLVLASDGSVGIGTTSPQHRFEVRNGNAGQAAYIRSDSTSGTNIGVDAEAMGDYADTNIGGWFAAHGATNNYAILVPPGYGSVGIGTTTPSQLLDVAGYVKGQTGLCIGDDCRTSWPSGSGGTIGGSGSTNYVPKFTGSTSIGNSTIYESSANVGIGSTNPTARLEIGGSGNLKLKANVNDPGDIIFEDGGGMQKGRIWAEPAAGVAGLQFSSSDTTPDIAIDASGNIGIGTTSPGAKLDVNGTTKTKVLTITGGSDLAEPFQLVDAERVEPGMVLALDPQRHGLVRISRTAYDPLVAGVVSGANGVQPGITLRQEGTHADGTVPLAMSGRVYALADASYGSIHVGDLLVTSSTPGYVMRASRPYPHGAVIGKAMSSLERGQGYVFMLIWHQ